MPTDTVNGPSRRTRTTHTAALCVDHLDAPFEEREELELTVGTTRDLLASARDAGQWVYDHLSALSGRHGLATRVQPHPSVDSAAFLVQPWSGRWRWAHLPASTGSTTPVENLGATTDEVLQHVAPAWRPELVRFIGEADGSVDDTHLLLLGPGDAHPRPSAIYARRLGTADDPLVVGVWLSRLP